MPTNSAVSKYLVFKLRAIAAYTSQSKRFMLE
jgi:hypothetical protein